MGLGAFCFFYIFKYYMGAVLPRNYDEQPNFNGEGKTEKSVSCLKQVLRTGCMHNEGFV